MSMMNHFKKMHSYSFYFHTWFIITKIERMAWLEARQTSRQKARYPSQYQRWTAVGFESKNFPTKIENENIRHIPVYLCCWVGRVTVWAGRRVGWHGSYRTKKIVFYMKNSRRQNKNKTQRKKKHTYPYEELWPGIKLTFNKTRKCWLQKTEQQQQNPEEKTSNFQQKSKKIWTFNK